MADYNSSLPVRTETAGDVIVKVADATVPSQQLAVEADGSINVNAVFAPGGAFEITDGTDTLEVNADGSINSVVTATDLDIRNLTATDVVTVVQATHDNLNLNANIQVGNTDVANGNPVPVSDAGGSLTVDASNLDIRDLVFATDKVDVSDSVVALDATTLAALESITVQNGAGGAAVNIQDGGNSITVDGTVTVTATDLDIRDLSAAQDSVAANIRDESGNAFSASNPLPVTIVDSEGTEVNDYNTATVASGATNNHDYTTLAAFKLSRIWAAASGKMKITVQIETASGSNTFNTVFVGFNSTAHPNIELPVNENISVVSGARVRIIRQNNDNQSQDVYSTISGH